MTDDTRSAPATASIRYGEFVTLTACLMALNALAIDVMLPALQLIGEDLAVADENARQLTITAYIIGFGIAQVAYGPISDRFGRKPVLLFGLVIYAVAGLLAASAWSFSALLAFRALQGLGSAATRVIAISVVRDRYSGRQMASVMSLVMMVFMAVPILAPGLGELIMLASGWRSIFALVAFLGMAVTLWSLFRLPETLAVENRRALTVAKVGEAFRIVLTNRVSLGYTFGTALIMGCLFAFINSAQQVYVGLYDLGSLFPLAFSGSAILIGAAAFANSRLVQRFGMRRTLAWRAHRVRDAERHTRHVIALFGRASALPSVLCADQPDLLLLRIHRDEFQCPGNGAAWKGRRDRFLRPRIHADGRRRDGRRCCRGSL